MLGFFPHQPDLVLSQEMREFVDPEGNRYRNVREAKWWELDVAYFAIWKWPFIVDFPIKNGDFA